MLPCSTDNWNDAVSNYLARRAGVIPAALTNALAAKVANCTNELAGTVQASTPMINIPTVFVDVSIGGRPFTYARSKVTNMVTALNNAYRRFGFSFSFAEQIPASFASLNDARCNGTILDLATCARCRWYSETMPARYRSSQVLMIYMLEANPNSGWGASGEAMLPYDLLPSTIPGNSWHCGDGMFIQAQSIQDGSTTEKSAYDEFVAVHEVRRMHCRMLHNNGARCTAWCNQGLGLTAAVGGLSLG